MSLTLDLADDLLVCDDLRTLTLKIEGQGDVLLSKCVLDEPLLVKEMEPAHGQVPQTDRRFHWPQKRSVQPPLGSVLVDEAGTYWTILAVEHRNLVQTWAARARNLAVISAVANTATLLKATYGKGRANEAMAQWVGLFSGESPPTEEDTVPARFQPFSEEAELIFGAEWTKETYRVIFDQAVPMELAGGEYRMIDKDGFRYRIVKYVNEQRIDRLPIAIAIRILEGPEYWNQGPPVDS